MNKNNEKRKYLIKMSLMLALVFSLILSNINFYDIKVYASNDSITNFNINSWDIDKLGVNWDIEDNKEYKVWLVDSEGVKVVDSESNWLVINSYIFENLGLLSNTMYVPHIISRPIGSDLTDIISQSVENNEKTYTNAKHASQALFLSGIDNIKISLIVEKNKNADDTNYHIKNDVTGQINTSIYHNNPVWINSGLSRRGYYSYSIKVINKNGNPSNWSKIMFFDGELAHTLLKDEFDILIDIKDKDDGSLINLDVLNSWNYNTPVNFNPVDLVGNKVILNEKVVRIINKNKATITLDGINNASEYKVLKDASKISQWKEIEDNKIINDIYFNKSGFYEFYYKFKHLKNESEYDIINIYSDSIKPTIEAEKKIKGQYLVTRNKDFTITLNAKDNVSPYLFYSLDEGATWFLINKENQNMDITFTNLNKNMSGFLNELTIQVADISGNISTQVFYIWGLN